MLKKGKSCEKTELFCFCFAFLFLWHKPFNGNSVKHFARISSKFNISKKNRPGTRYNIFPLPWYFSLLRITTCSNGDGLSYSYYYWWRIQMQVLSRKVETSYRSILIVSIRPSNPSVVVTLITLFKHYHSTYSSHYGLAKIIVNTIVCII